MKEHQRFFREQGGAFPNAHCLPAAVRTVLALCAVLAIASVISYPSIFNTPDGVDDVTWAKRSLAPWWFSGPWEVNDGWHEEHDKHAANQKWSNDYFRNYYYSIDHPSIGRLVYKPVLRLAGVKSIEAEDWDYAADPQTNMRLNRFLPSRIRNLLRCVNAVFFAAALLVVYGGLNRVTRNRALAAICACVIAVDPTITGKQFGIVSYIGADAVFYFLLAVSWYAWLRAGRSIASAVLVGLCAGLLTSTKANGAFVVIAAAVYCWISVRGVRGLAHAAVLCLTATFVFLVLNPVYVTGGPAWAVKAFSDSFVRRLAVREEHIASPYFTHDRIQIFFLSLPEVLLIVPIVAVLFHCARKPWFRPTAYWSAANIIGNMLIADIFLPKYAAPERLSFLVLLLACGASLLRPSLRLLRISKGRWSRRVDNAVARQEGRQ